MEVRGVLGGQLPTCTGCTELETGGWNLAPADPIQNAAPASRWGSWGKGIDQADGGVVEMAGVAGG